jgi:hypothetical protein
MDLKSHTLVLALALGLVVALVACGPAPTVTPYPTYTSAPTARPTPTIVPILAAPAVIVRGWEALGLSESPPMPDVPHARLFWRDDGGGFGAFIVESGTVVSLDIYAPDEELLENMMLAAGTGEGVARVVIDAVRSNLDGYQFIQTDLLFVFVDVEAGSYPTVHIVPTGGVVWEATPTPRLDLTPTQAVTATTRPTPAPRTSFGDGTWLVGVDIAPGTYRTTVPGNGCMWQRLSGLSGTYEDIIAWGAPNSGQALVAIAPSDLAFSTDACGEWSLLS